MSTTFAAPRGLTAADEVLHPIEDVPLWSENYLSQAYAPEDGVGFFLHHGRTAFDPRLWNELLVAYLPGDQFLVARGFGYGEPAAGPAGPGLRYECAEPFQRWRKTYRGAARQVSGDALRERPLVDGLTVGVEMELVYEALTPAFYLGDMEEQNWAATHYEQHCRVTGHLTYDGQTVALSGSGIRDHSWGPRDLTSLATHIWTHGQFDDGRSFCLMHVANQDGTGRMSHATFSRPDGSMVHGRLLSAPPLLTDEAGGDAAFELRFDVDGDEVVIGADVLQTAPLTIAGPAELVVGFDRSGPLAHHLLFESALRLTWDGETGYGHAERSLQTPQLRPLPQGPEALQDGTWLTTALRRDGVLGADESVTVTSSEPIGDGLAARMFRVGLHGPEAVPSSVVVKLPVVDETRAMLDGIQAYQREVAFYRSLAKEAPVRTPHCYVAEQDSASSDFVLVIEDLGGLTAPDQLAGFTRAQVEAVVDRLAELHAWSWEDEERLDAYASSFWPVDSPAGAAVQEQLSQLFGVVWDARREHFAALLPPDAVAIGDRFATLGGFFLAQLSTPRTITHGELRADNLFFDGDEPVFFDFQVTQQECGVRELSYLLTSSLSLETARALEDELVERYWRGLVDAGVQDYPLERAREQYRIAAAYNLLWGVVASMRWEAATDRGRALLEDLVRRAGAAIERQRTLEVLPAAPIASG